MEEFAIQGQINLTQEELLYLFKIGNSEKPSGIIDNKSNEVLVRNKASLEQLQSWGTSIENTSRLWDPLKLSKLQADIELVKNGENFERVYYLILPKVGLVHLTDKFTRITYKKRLCRLFEQLDVKVVRRE